MIDVSARIGIGDDHPMVPRFLDDEETTGSFRTAWYLSIEDSAREGRVDWKVLRTVWLAWAEARRPRQGTLPL